MRRAQGEMRGGRTREMLGEGGGVERRDREDPRPGHAWLEQACRRLGGKVRGSKAAR
jgi:hypothetical protein